MNIYDAKGRPIWLGEIVGRGGEATVYRLRAQTGWLAKIYENEARSNYPDKLAWMVAHPPENPTRAIAHPSLAWPASLLYDSKHKLAGYLMPYIHSTVPMLEVFNPRRRQATLPRFDRRYLHRTARNLSATLNALHDGGYVIGDLNESNVLVTPSALISLIDTDSFQVPEVRGEQTIYHPCPVGKLEYTPPELHKVSIGSVVRCPEHDAFALGVLIFQLLMEGSHPFRAQWLGSGDPPPIETRIAQGVFPYTTVPDGRVRPPKGAPDLNLLHPALVELVYRCFIDGHQQPHQRPTPSHWERALAEAENALVQCPNLHLYSNHLKACPHCQATPRKAGRSAPASSRARGEAWRNPRSAGRSAAAAGQASSPPLQTAPPGATSRSGASARQAGPQAAQSGPGKTQPKSQPQPGPAFRWARPSATRPAPVRPAINWRDLINSFITNPWPQPAYPAGAPYRPKPSPPPPSQPAPKSQPIYKPASQPVSLKAWAKPRLSKSVMTGGGQGALVGALMGGLVALITASLGDTAAFILLWALGGAAAGVLRGWKPGYRASLWVDGHIGWHRVWPVLGLLGGAIGGMLAGLLVGWWAVLPVFIGLFYGAKLGKRLGHKTAELGSRLGWERIWAGLGAAAAALVGWHVAAWLGGGAVGSLTAQGVTSLAGWISGGVPSLLITAGVSGVLCGALAGAVSGSLTDLVARFSGLVD